MTFLRDYPQADLKTVLRVDPQIGLPFARLHEVLLRGPSAFSIAERELMGAFVSALNRCKFCHGEHEAVARRFGIEAGVLDDLLASRPNPGINPALEPVFAYLRKVTLTPSQIEAGDVQGIHEAGWDDRALLQVVAIAGLFAFDNRIIDGLGIPPHEPEKLRATVERLYADGYTSTEKFIAGELKLDV
jgi:uncharacterized peroxidase-related enzyme